MNDYRLKLKELRAIIAEARTEIANRKKAKLQEIFPYCRNDIINIAPHMEFRPQQWNAVTKMSKGSTYAVKVNSVFLMPSGHSAKVYFTYNNDYYYLSTKDFDIV